jgi:uncharacterized cupredoxin-like copper-binding protein
VSLIVRPLLALCVALALLAAACGGGAASDPGDVPTLYVDLSDFKVAADHATVPAGKVVFGIRNHAAMAHELKVIKTDRAAEALEVDASSAKAKEDGKVGELLNISAGASRKLVLELAPGRYVLICNIAGHYQLGMRTSLVVQ